MPKKQTKPGALDQVLFVRVDAALLAKVDKLVERERQLKPGTSCSRSDVVRDILWARIYRDEEAARLAK